MTIEMMIDIETLGTKPNAVVLSVAATAFTQADGIVDEFETTLDVDEQIEQLDRSIDYSTLVFWMDQPKKAKEKAFSETRDALGGGLSEFIGFFNNHRHDRDPLPTWALPPSFDATITGHLIHTFGLNVPWHYRELRDLRTLLDATGDPSGIKMAAYGDPKMIGFVPHDPLWDCRLQVETLRRARVRLAMSMAKENLTSG